IFSNSWCKFPIIAIKMSSSISIPPSLLPFYDNICISYKGSRNRTYHTEIWSLHRHLGTCALTQLTARFRSADGCEGGTFARWNIAAPTYLTFYRFAQIRRKFLLFVHFVHFVSFVPIVYFGISCSR